MLNTQRKLMKNFVLWNVITGLFLFPIGIGFSVSFVVIFTVGSFIFEGSINSVFIPICMCVVFIALRILLYSNKLYEKKIVRVFIKVYLIIDYLFCHIAFIGYCINDYFEIFRNSSFDRSTKIILLICYVFSSLMLIVFAILVYLFYRKTSDEQKCVIIKKIYKTYFFLIPIFVLIFILTSHLSFYSVLGALESMIWGFTVYMTEIQSQSNQLVNQSGALSENACHITAP